MKANNKVLHISPTYLPTAQMTSSHQLNPDNSFNLSLSKPFTSGYYNPKIALVACMMVLASIW
jgi:hypothetical protein